MKKSRLKKVAEQGMDVPISIILNDPLQIVDNKDEILDITYGPSISRKWEFEEPRDYSEWNLQKT